jgi:short-subunit dehydrogenase
MTATKSVAIVTGASQGIGEPLPSALHAISGMALVSVSQLHGL